MVNLLMYASKNFIGVCNFVVVVVLVRSGLLWPSYVLAFILMKAGLFIKD